MTSIVCARMLLCVSVCARVSTWTWDRRRSVHPDLALDSWRACGATRAGTSSDGSWVCGLRSRAWRAPAASWWCGCTAWRSRRAAPLRHRRCCSTATRRPTRLWPLDVADAVVAAAAVGDVAVVAVVAAVAAACAAVDAADLACAVMRRWRWCWCWRWQSSASAVATCRSSCLWASSLD